MKYNIVLQGSIFSSNGFLVCCGITILFIYKVLSIAMFEPFKVVGVVVCGVACKDNSKVDRCRDNGVALANYTYNCIFNTSFSDNISG